MEKETLTRVLIWVGPILGALIGVLGGVLGTYFSIKNTKGPRERAFVVRASVVCWVGVTVFVLGMWLVPAPYKYGLILVYVLALLWGVRSWNKRQATIRVEESNQNSGPATTDGPPQRPAQPEP